MSSWSEIPRQLENFFSIEKYCKSYGQFVGRRPCLVACMGAVISLVLSTGWIFFDTNDADMEQLWTPKGSRLEEEYNLKKDLHQSQGWQREANIVMISGKGEGDDVLMPTHFEEMLSFYKAANSLSVATQSGTVFRMTDLCWRPAELASTGLPLTAPCIMVTPLLCFREMAETFDIAMSFIDEYLPQPFASRPSFRNMTGRELKASISHGCNHTLLPFVFEPKHWIGGLTTKFDSSGKIIEKAESVQLNFLMDGPQRALRRMREANMVVTEGEVVEGIRRMNQALVDFVRSTDHNHEAIEVTILPSGFADSVNDEAEEVPKELFWLGIAAMVIFLHICLANPWEPTRSHAGIGCVALCCVMVSLFASVGAISLTGLKWNGTMIQSFGFLGLGLGINDMFVVLLCLSDRGATKIAEEGVAETMMLVTEHAGPGVFLTSLCNAAAFSVGSFIPVPAMADFCSACAILAIVNFIVVMLLFLPCLYWEAARLARRRADPSPVTWCCHRLKVAADAEALSASGSKGWGVWLRTVIEHALVPCLMKRYVQILVLAGSAGALAACIYSLSNVEMGVDLADLISDDSPHHRAFEQSFKHYSYLPAELVYHDVDIAKDQQAILDLLTDIMTVDQVEPTFLPPFLTMLYVYLAQKMFTTLPGSNTTFMETGWTFDAAAGGHPQYAPAGVVAPEKFYEIFEMWRIEDFVMFDMCGGTEFSYDTDRTIRYGFDRFVTQGMRTTKDYVNLIERVREKIDNSPLQGKVFPGGTAFTFWEIYIELEAIFWKSFAFDIAVVFAGTCAVIRAVRSSVFAVFACGIIVIEVFGILVTFAKFNMVTACTLLMAMGMSVEFIQHNIATFEMAKGTKRERLSAALRVTLPAVLLGAGSTVCGLLPLAFSELPFLRKYFFATFTTVAGVGFVNSWFILPAILAALSPERAVETKTEEQERADDAAMVRANC